MKKSQLKSLIREAVSSRLAEAQDFMAQLKTSGKLEDPTGVGSDPTYSETYQLTGETKYDAMRFFYKPENKKTPYGIIYIQGHGISRDVMRSVGMGYETRTGTAGVDAYLHDGNYNPSWVSEQDFIKAVTDFNSGFSKYAKSYSDFYKGRGLSPGVGDMMQEGVMSDIDILAQESTTFEEFLNKIRSNPEFKRVDLLGSKEVVDFLKQMWNERNNDLQETKMTRAKLASIIREEVRNVLGKS